MNACTQLQEYLTQGAILRDQRGKFIMRNGAPILRNTFDEPLINAIQRQLVPKANYIPVYSSEREELGGVYAAHRKQRRTHSSQWHYQEDTEDEAEDSKDYFHRTYPATRHEKSTTQAHKEKFDGVWVLSCKELEAWRQKENRPPQSEENPSRTG